VRVRVRVKKKNNAGFCSFIQLYTCLSLLFSGLKLKLRLKLRLRLVSSTAAMVQGTATGTGLTGHKITWTLFLD